MLKSLSQHPFPVEAHFDFSLVLTYAFPTDALAGKVPDCLALDTFEDDWAFLAVAMVQTRKLRPRGFPAWIGNDFFLSGYRIFVRYQSQEGRKLRGLYILRSETDKLRMKLLGNVFTNYRYAHARMQVVHDTGRRIEVRSPDTGLAVEARIDDPDCALPEASPFADWREARRFAGPMPFTFSVEPEEVVVVEGKRTQWQPRPVKILKHEVPFLESFSAAKPILANAFITENVDYAWDRGRKEARR